MINYILILLSFNIALLSASEQVKGVVKSGENLPLAGAKVFYLDTDIGTITDSVGRFSIENSKDNHMIVVQFIGFQSDTIHIEDDKQFYELVLVKEYDTEEVTVESNRETREIDKSSIAVRETITERGLQKAACCNLAESFVTNSAIDVEQSDAVTGARKIKLLGLDGKYSQTMTENIPNIRGLALMYGLGYIPGTWMESISISKGAASVRNGFESITGQINVEFKKPRETFEDAHINIYANQMGRMEANVLTKYDVNDNLSTKLFLHGSMFNNEIDQNSDAFTDKALSEQLNLINYWDYSGDNHESKSGIKALTENMNGGQLGFQDNDNLWGFENRTNRIELFSKNGFFFNESTDNLENSLGTIVNYTYHNQNSEYGDRIYNAEQNSFYANFLYTKGISDNLKFTSGASIQYDNFLETVENDFYGMNLFIPGLYSEVNWKLSEKLALTGGIRADHHNEEGLFFTPRLHAKYVPSEKLTFRASAGKGYRNANIFAENVQLLLSSREFNLENNYFFEEAWNYGVSAIYEFEISNTDFIWTADFYRTDFINQVVVDMDRDPGEVFFYNLEGESFSNSFQTDLMVELPFNFTINYAYRFNDVNQTISGVLRRVPLYSPHRSFLNFEYSTKSDSWRFDFTIDYHSSGRLPDTDSNPEEYQLSKEFDPYFIFNGQITKRFGDLDIYIGGENLSGFTQSNPILAADQPFGEHFDSSMIWGPIMGRVIYAGMRYSYK